VEATQGENARRRRSVVEARRKNSSWTRSASRSVSADSPPMILHLHDDCH
jgi:hypothetical protein